MKNIKSLNKKITLILVLIAILPLIGIAYIKITNLFNYREINKNALLLDQKVLDSINSESMLKHSDTLVQIINETDTKYNVSNISIINKEYRYLMGQAYYDFQDAHNNYINLMNDMLSNKEFCKSRYGIFYNLFYDKTYIGDSYYAINEPFNGEEILKAQQDKIAYKIRYNYNYLTSKSDKSAKYYIAIPHNKTAMGDIIILIAFDFYTMVPYEILCWISICLSFLLLLIILPILFSIITLPIKRLSKEIRQESISSKLFLTPNISYVNKQNEIGDISRAYKTLISKTNNKISSIETYSKEIAEQLHMPLEKLKNELSILRNNNQDTVNTREHLSKILDLSRKIDQILTKLRTITKIKNQSYDLTSETIPIDLFIKNLTVNLLEAAEREFSLDLNCGNKTLNIEEEHFVTLLSELLNNAIDTNSKISLYTKIIRYNHEKCLKLSVEDSNTTTAEKLNDNIFENFYTTKDSNIHLGLGLPLVKAIVSNRNGTIKVSRSKNLGGACFTAIIPLAE